MTILWVFDEKHPKQVSAYGYEPRPCGIPAPSDPGLLDAPLSYASSASTKASIWAAKRSLIEVEPLAARTLAFCTVCGVNLTVTFRFRIWVILHSPK
jgi:hypothetical protein